MVKLLHITWTDTDHTALSYGIARADFDGSTPPAEFFEQVHAYLAASPKEAATIALEWFGYGDNTAVLESLQELSELSDAPYTAQQLEEQRLALPQFAIGEWD
ncbi:hypothetical protein BH11PSE2_BH11PSE2_04580 [soil metagenome]